MPECFSTCWQAIASSMVGWLVVGLRSEAGSAFLILCLFDLGDDSIGGSEETFFPSFPRAFGQNIKMTDIKNMQRKFFTHNTASSVLFSKTPWLKVSWVVSSAVSLGLPTPWWSPLTGLICWIPRRPRVCFQVSIPWLSIKNLCVSWQVSLPMSTREPYRSTFEVDPRLTCRRLDLAFLKPHFTR